MKFLVISPSIERGGTEKYALTIASAAVREGWDVHAAFPRTHGTSSLIQEFKVKGVHYHCLQIAEKHVYKLRKIRKYFLPFVKTLFLLLKLRPSIVQVNLPWSDHCLASIFACALLRIPTVVVFHLTPCDLLVQGMKLKVYAWARSRNQQWIAVSENNRKIICKSFDVSDEEVLCIHNGIKLANTAIDTNLEEITTLRYQVRQKLRLPENSKIALTVSRLHPLKGYSDIIPTIPQIVNDFPDLRFVWVGEGEQREYLTKKVQEYGVEDKVMFLGYRSDVPELMKSADLFIFPTHHEGHPFVLLEAMAHNLPIVASDIGAILEIVEHKVHGLLFRTGDSYDLLETLCWALKHPDQMQEMAQNAKLRVQEFSEEIMVNKTLALLRQLSCMYRATHSRTTR